jgi:3-oxoacyl-[acyl-carrier protein] reductase
MSDPRDPRDTLDLGGRVAIVTGAGSGIGAASARMLAGAGATVVCADRNADGADATGKAIADAGGTASAVELDVSRRDDVEALVRDTVAQHGRLDVMANIAGIIHQSLVVDTDEADFDRVLATNLKGVLFGCQSAARVMIDQGRGSIVNMASAAIDTPAPNLVCYAVAKAGVAQLTKTLAAEVGSSGVRVNAIAPGFVITGMTSRHFVRDDGSVDEDARKLVIDAMTERVPLGREGRPDDIAHSVLFLASDASSYMTGQVLRPNGGVAMP